MSVTMFPALLAVLCLAASVPAHAQDAPPPLPREFRGVWVATVANIDWPSTPGLSVQRQKQQLIDILDKAAKMHLNAVVFQVRPACDAMYASKIEPWSEYLTGTAGKAPEPFYDPLAFAVEEAHKRGLELHAWFNPYRARHSGAKSPVPANHISKKRPNLVRTYGKHLWLDPGEEDVREYSLSVIVDVVRRYEVDGVHIDDYFYPYKEKDASGDVIDFPDSTSYAKYKAGGGTLSKDDWRRHNVDLFVEQMYQSVKAVRPSVKVGISPFGIWRPGNPESIKGFDAYAEIYADSRKWLEEGWCDYYTPQLYWPIGQVAQSYPVLLKWWVEHNPKKRHMWPGNYTSRVADGSKTAWRADEVVDQVKATRSQPGATGNVHFSMIAFLNNQGGVADALTKTVYANQALVPECPWLDILPPDRPSVTAARSTKGGEAQLTVRWKPGSGERVFLWAVQTRREGKWSTCIVTGSQTELVLTGPAAGADLVAVSAVSRSETVSRPGTAKPE